MPAAGDILQDLGEIANAWTLLALLWHVYFAGLIGTIALGCRPSRRVIGALLIVPLVSVSVLAWRAGNPFNGTVFALAGAVLVLVVVRWPSTPVELRSKIWFSAGSAFVVFGWVYPHFLETGSLLPYLYAAPVGLIPCPTLSILSGLTLMLGGFNSTAWTSVLGIASLFYGIFGSVHLGVTIDWVLSLGALCLFALLVTHLRHANEGAT